VLTIIATLLVGVLLAIGSVTGTLPGFLGDGLFDAIATSTTSAVTATATAFGAPDTASSAAGATAGLLAPAIICLLLVEACLVTARWRRGLGILLAAGGFVSFLTLSFWSAVGLFAAAILVAVLLFAATGPLLRAAVCVCTGYTAAVLVSVVLDGDLEAAAAAAAAVSDLLDLGRWGPQFMGVIALLPLVVAAGRLLQGRRARN
jgi:hypothetical protein